jgi:hypothetical protein
MRIIKGEGFWTFIPVSETEKTMIAFLLDSGIVKGDLLWFFAKDFLEGLNVCFNGRSFDFCGEEDNDKAVLEKIKYHAKKSGQPIRFFKEGTIDDVRTLSITIGFCKKCRKPINDEISLTFSNICRSCAKDCEHIFVENDGNKGRHCNKCGMPKSGRKRSKR